MNIDTDISVIIPAFNEAQRLPPFLERLIAYCSASSKKYELIVVDDGSQDATYVKALEFKSRFPRLQVIRLEKNEGAGYATKRGFLAAKGKIILSMDADGSVSPEEIEKNLGFFDQGYDIVVGSRGLRSEGQVLKTMFARRMISAIFNFLIRSILSLDIKDTQCGFIMFRQDVIDPVFSITQLHGFGAYIEIFYLANKMGLKIKEAPISWEHKSGTKVRFIRDSLTMLINIFQVRYRHWRHTVGGLNK